MAEPGDEQARKPIRKRVRVFKRPKVADCVICGCLIEQRTEGCGRTRTICSRDCKREWQRRYEEKRRKALVVRNCAACGKPSGHLLYCSDKCRHPGKYAAQKCDRCGVEFHSRYKRRFCSRRCQYNGAGQKFGDDKKCEGCGRAFRPKKRIARFCSKKCAKPARKFKCLNCGVEFAKKRYKSGAYSCQYKYCGRPCAFEARRLKKPCAVRPLDLAAKLQKWFFSWGDDVWPQERKCSDCGVIILLRSEADVGKTKCRDCKAGVTRACIGCGSLDLRPYYKRCVACWATNSRRVKQSLRRNRRAKHGHESTIRARCRKHGAIYTPVSKSLIYRRDGWQCQLCLEPLLPKYTTIAVNGGFTVHDRSPTIDHVFPLSMGAASPGHVPHNVVACCHACNSKKSASDPTGWASLRPRSANLPTPPMQHD